VSVNVSPCELDDPDFASRVLQAVARHGLDPRRLVVELTETALVQGPRQLAQVAALREAGVAVALDDFGSGYAGLLALRSVPVDRIKLDREFTLHLSDPHTASIVGAIVALAQSLGVMLVAEGVETAEVAQQLQRLGVRYGQGWHLGRPGPLLGGDPAADPRP
jgi:EAL domain-containing protein (putative c-di-GMP-specific phosphodiesterase class I)